MEDTQTRVEETKIEGRNAVLEAFRSGKTIDKLYVLDGCQDGPVRTIVREARKHDTILNFVSKERLDQISETGKHQGVIAQSAAYSYAEVEDILQIARDKGEAPFVILLDNIEDPHNLGAIIRTANLAGAHGVIIPKRRAVGLTATVAKASAGAINYTPVAKVTNLTSTIEELKKEGMWFVCADMGGTQMYDLNLKGSIGLVIGNEGEGVSKLVREARKHDTILNFVSKERLDQISETGKHQGVIAQSAAYSYAEVEDILQIARDKGEAPFVILLDNIEDPHNLGAIIRTANLAGAHGVIIPKRRAVGLTATVAKASAGAINYTPVAKVTNLTSTIEELKKEGMWFVCADMGGTQMYDLNLKGSIGLVIGNEGEGVSKLVREHCDMIASIPMKGDIDSLNASVACGVLAYEIVRQRLQG